MTKWSHYTYSYSIRVLTPVFDLDLGRRNLNLQGDTPSYNSEHFCQVILKSLYACRSFAPDTRFSTTSKCDLDL